MGGPAGALVGAALGASAGLIRVHMGRREAPAANVRMMAAAAQSGGVPPSFICPITLEVMQDPVTAADGHSYEAEAIRQWFRTSNLSPSTGLPMQSRKLIPSHALRNAILEFQSGASPVAQQAAKRPPPERCEPEGQAERPSAVSSVS